MKLATCILILCTALPSMAQDDQRVKAVFISKFIDYTNWPDSKKQMIIGIVGNSEALVILTQMCEKKKNCTVKKITRLEEFSECQVIYVPNHESKNFGMVEQAIKGRHILVIAEEQKLASQGACIGFYEEGTKLKFIINKDAVEKAGLKIAHDLMTLAKVI
jgi:ABC-type uncharacterized transport system substrate-binding protein